MPLGNRSARRRGMITGAAIASSRARKKQAASPSVPADRNDTSTDDVASQIEKFANLRDKGIITEEEFSAKKKQLLGI